MIMNEISPNHGLMPQSCTPFDNQPSNDYARLHFYTLATVVERCLAPGYGSCTAIHQQHGHLRQSEIPD